MAPVAILIVNGGRDPSGGSWIGLCLSKLQHHTNTDDYDLYLWNNNKGSAVFRDSVALHAPDARIFEPEPGEVLWEFHAIPLQRMYEAAALHGYEWIVTLDSDAHILSDDWLNLLREKVRGNTVLGGVWRDELATAITPYVHASCLCVRTDFLEKYTLRFDAAPTDATNGREDTISHFTRVANAHGLDMFKLTRSNKGEFHFLIGGVYGGLVYHHGAGSRQNVLFWGEIDSSYRRHCNTFLSQLSATLLMSDYDSYIGFLQSGAVSRETLRYRLLFWLSGGRENLSRRLFLWMINVPARVAARVTALGNRLVKR